ncbi:MAG: hypothetical protein U9R19_02535 [Bacteroidota bacterium]|nr:hypothetical protein [Bacteroidota bacterium]
MKNSIIIIAFGLVLSLGFVSCETCIKCEILGNIPDTSFLSPDTSTLKGSIASGLIDTNNIYYDEFCGSSSEIEAFEADVKFASDQRQCKIYSIRKIATLDTMATLIYCGGWQHFEDFEYGLDTLIITTYANQDAEWVIDTVLLNPATWTCK